MTTPDHLDNDDDNDGIPDNQDKSIEEILAGGRVYEGINFKVNRKHFPGISSFFVRHYFVTKQYINGKIGPN